jgi:hypothetical protein
MRGGDQGFVTIVRDFLHAHQLMRRLVARYRSSELRFQELHQLVGDDDESVLYRLKERCHALFRSDIADSTLAVQREALFDLAVGSLFHDAMTFRENFYQREVYGPRVRELQSRAGEDSAGLFEEFEKILGAVSRRLEEGLEEAEALLDEMSGQLRLLLPLHRHNGFLARFLLEHAQDAEDVLGGDFDALLVLTYGAAADGYRTAGRSYLASGYYAQAVSAFRAARERGGDPAELDPLLAFAKGMQAYLERDYTRSVEQLSVWAGAALDDPPDAARLAHAVVSRVGQLVQGDGRESVSSAARDLLERMGHKAGGDQVSI